MAITRLDPSYARLLAPAKKSLITQLTPNVYDRRNFLATNRLRNGDPLGRIVTEVVCGIQDLDDDLIPTVDGPVLDALQEQFNQTEPEKRTKFLPGSVGEVAFGAFEEATVERYGSIFNTTVYLAHTFGHFAATTAWRGIRKQINTFVRDQSQAS